MSDEDGPDVAALFYKALFEAEILDADAIAYAIDEAVRELRYRGVPAIRWATFIHLGA
jgi:hypothetical protein